MGLERWIYKLPLRFRSLFRRSRVEQELREEFEYHLQRKIEYLKSQGMPEQEARNQAMRAMQGMEQQKEKCREARGVNWIEDLFTDLRYALRTFRKHPSLALVITVSLALGIGANTAIFSLINAVSLKMLPVQEPGRLMLLSWSAKDWPRMFVDDLEGNGGRDAGGIMSSTSFSANDYAEFKKQNDVFEPIFAYAANDSNVNIAINGAAESAHLQAVSGDFFSGLGVTPIFGRALLPSDDTPSASSVAIVSYDFWRKHFDSETNVNGKTITMNGQPITILGVAPPEFFGILPGNPVDVYIPLNLYRDAWTRIYDDNLSSPTTWWLQVIGRLKAGVSEEAARSELQVIFDRTLRARVQTTASTAIPNIGFTPAGRGLNDLRRRFSTSLLLLMGMVALVLLIACANVAGLLMARASARQKEIAVRLSLGASRGRIVRQLLAESVLLALVGGIAGLLASVWASAALVHLLGSGRNPLNLSAGIDWHVLAFTAAVSILSGIFFGLMPALAATRVSVAPALKDSRMEGSLARGRFQVGKALVGGQVALSLLLLVASGLLLRTLNRLQHVSLGFDQHALLSFEVRPGLNGYKDQRLIDYYQELQRRIQSLAGVLSVALTQHGPIDSGYSSNSAQIPGYTAPGQSVDLYRHEVGPNYFSTLNIPILLGRAIGEQDTATAPKALVVNEAVVRRYFHGDNPIGKHLVYDGRNKMLSSYEIVGVARDVKYGNLRSDPPPTAYWSYKQPKLVSAQMVFLVRTQGDPQSIENSVRQVCLDLDRGVPVVRMKTEEDVVAGSLLLERIFALLSGAFAGLALLLACVGLYGTIGYSVTRRTAEIGVRMALGAERGRILVMVLTEVSLLVIAGIAVGLPLAWSAARLLSHQLYELSPHDPLTIAASVVAIVLITLLAGYAPARRASKVDPMVALRYE